MMFDDDSFEENKTYIKLDVEGKNPALWSGLKAKLVNAVEELLNFQINSKTEGSLKQEIGRVSSNLIEFANSKLERPSIENQKLLAEIEEILAKKAKCVAEARKLNAEADEIELNQILKRFKIALGLSKAIAIAENDVNFIMFTKSLEDVIYNFQPKNSDDTLLG